MAIFIPESRPVDFNGSFGEKEVYDSLKALSDDYTVFYSLSWVGYEDKNSVGEADFVIAHPEKGILVIEVKAGAIEYKNGEWLQINTKSQKSKQIEPFVQARKSQFELMHRLSRGIRDFKLPMFCYCVWFTSVEIGERELLPMESPNEIILDVLDLDHPQKSVDGVFDYWAKKYKQIRLDDGQYKQVIEQLCPHFHVVPKIEIGKEDKKSYIQLTRNQSALLEFMETQKTGVIRGMSGTGKTVLAIENAKKLSKTEDSVLFLCFNNNLKKALEKRFLASGIQFHTPLTLNQNQSFANVVVDEAQAIDTEILDRLYDLAMSQNGRFFAFLNNDRINREDIPKWVEEADFRLMLKQNFETTD